jgi:hypothetical protein
MTSPANVHLEHVNDKTKTFRCLVCDETTAYTHIAIFEHMRVHDSAIMRREIGDPNNWSPSKSKGC